jgi:RNA polymerase sigma-70 factor (ECF subfamily)
MRSAAAIGYSVDRGMAQNTVRAVPGKPGQSAEWIAGHLKRIFVQIYRMVGNVDDAQELTQETFIKALQRQDQLSDAEKAAHWLSRIASNTTIDFLRRTRRVDLKTVEEMGEIFVAPRGEDPESQVLRAERRDWLQSALACLTERERMAIVLRDVEDLPAEEVARRMGCSQATVRSHIANARMKLQQHLARKGYRV